MSISYISYQKFQKFLGGLVAEAALYAPKASGDNLHYERVGVQSLDGITYDQVRAVEPLKSFFLSLKERVATYPSSSEAPQSKGIVILGPKSCDLKSLEVLDAVFKEGEFKDPFYIARRDNTLLISSDCSSPKDTCSCSLLEVNPYPEAGFDLNLSKIADGFIMETGSPRGERLVNENKDLFQEADSDRLKEKEANRDEVLKEVREKNSSFIFKRTYQEIVRNGFDSDAWKAEADKCVECAACTQVCPTCYCFLLYDQPTQPEHQAISYEKIRNWDSCQYPQFAKVAGGANPRKRREERLRHRYVHKFDYFLDSSGIVACTGCGRCIETCPGKIDMREVISKLVHSS